MKRLFILFALQFVFIISSSGSLFSLHLHEEDDSHQCPASSNSHNSSTCTICQFFFGPQGKYTFDNPDNAIFIGFDYESGFSVIGYQIIPEPLILSVISPRPPPVSCVKEFISI